MQRYNKNRYDASGGGIFAIYFIRLIIRIINQGNSGNSTERVQLSQAFDREDLGATIYYKGITALNFDQVLPDGTYNKLSPDQFMTLATIIVHNYTQGNGSTTLCVGSTCDH